MDRVARYITCRVTGPIVGLDRLFATPFNRGWWSPTLTVTFARAPTSDMVLVLVVLMVPVTIATLAMPGDNPMTIGPPARLPMSCAIVVVVLGRALKMTFFLPIPG